MTTGSTSAAGKPVAAFQREAPCVGENNHPAMIGCIGYQSEKMRFREIQHINQSGGILAA